MLIDSGVYSDDEARIDMELKIFASKAQQEHIKGLIKSGYDTVDAIAKACNVTGKALDKLKKENFMLVCLKE